MWGYVIVGAYLGALALALVEGATGSDIAQYLKDYGTIIVGFPAVGSIFLAIRQIRSSQRQHAVETLLRFEAELAALSDVLSLAKALSGRISSKHDRQHLMAMGFRAGVRAPREVNDLAAVTSALSGRVRGRAQAALDWASDLAALIEAINSRVGPITDKEVDALERTEIQLHSASELLRSYADRRRSLIKQRLTDLGVPDAMLSGH